MSKLVEVLADMIGRTVVDKTGVSGTFNFQLDFSPDDAASTPKSAPPAAAGPERPIPATNVQAPTIFAALQEQLGLRLQAVKGQVEVLVIDHVQRPTRADAAPGWIFRRLAAPRGWPGSLLESSSGQLPASNEAESGERM